MLNGGKQSSGKRFQNNDSEDDPGSWKKNGEDARTKEQPEMDNTPEGIQSRKTEAEA